MSTTPENQAQSPPAAGFAKLASAIWLSPGEVGEAVAARTPWGAVGIAVVLIMAIMVGSTWLCRDLLLADTIEMMHKRMAKNPGMPAGQVEKVEAFWASTAGKAILVGSKLIVPLVGFPLIALALYLGQLLMGGRASFGQALAVTVLAALISFGAGSALHSALVLSKGSFMDVSTGLGVLVDAPMSDPLRSVLDFFDLFTLWAVLSAGAALARPARLSRGVAIGVSVAVYVLLGGLQIAQRVVFLK